MSVFKAKYYKADGSKGRARGLPDALFDGVVNEPVLHQVVKAIQANKRQGTAAAKNRSAVAGGSRKPWRQKGTGRARQGTTRAAQWTGGGLAFPPQPHGWRQRVPKKVRSLARRSALNARAVEERVVLVDGFSYDEPKTARLVGFLAGIEADGKVLVLTNGTNRNLYLSARNIPGVEIRPFGEESAYDLLWATTVVIEREALETDAAPAASAAVEAPEAPAAEAAAPVEAEPAGEEPVEAEEDVSADDGAEEGDDDA